MILRNLHIVGKSDEAKDIRIENEIISEINSPGLHKEDVEINFEDCIAFPGLINSHDHLEFNLYPQLGHKKYSDYVEWGNDIHSIDTEIINSIESIPVELRMKYGIIKNLICGVTAVAHHGVYNKCLEDSPVTVIQNCTSIHSVRLGEKWKLKLNWIKNLEPYVIHIGEGTNTESYEEINELIRRNLFNRKIIGIHGIAMNGKQSRNFVALIWCPVSNQFLFNKTADIDSLKKNTKILFGTDSTLTAGWNIWEHLRKAREMKLLKDEELFFSITNTAADVWGLNDCGEISEGKKANIIIGKRKSENLFESFYQINPNDIKLILINGKIILYDESMKVALSVLMKEKINFDEVYVNGKIKSINYETNQIIQDIKKLNSFITFPEDIFSPFGHKSKLK